MKTKITILIFFLVMLFNSKSYSYTIESINLQINDSVALFCSSFLYDYEEQIYFWSKDYKINYEGNQAMLTPSLVRYYNNKLDTMTLERFSVDSILLRETQQLVDMAISKKGNKYLLFAYHYLLQITNDNKLISYKDLFEKYNIPDPNAIAVDDDENIYLHANGYLYKITKDTLIELANVYDESWRQPHFLSYKNLHLVDNKLYFYNLDASISYYDLKTGKIDSLAIYDRVHDYIGSADYLSQNTQSVSNKFLNLVYKVPELQKFTILNYYPENDSIAILDNIQQRLVDDGYIFADIRYFGVDNKENYYFRISEFANNQKNDTLYIINTDLFLRKIVLGEKFDGIGRMDVGVRLSNDDIITTNYGPGLLKISGIPSSVEDYTNWLFLDGVYPNPARDYINIDFSVEPINLPNTKVKIYDYIGREVSQLSPKIEYNNATGIGKMTCDISEIQRGFYILVITNDKYSKSTPIYIE